METAQTFYDEMKKMIDAQYELYSQFKSLPTCDIADVYEWLDEVAKKLNIETE